MKWLEAIGTALREARNKEGMPQELAGDYVGKQQVWVSKVERGLIDIKLVDFVQLSTLYGTTVSLLLVRARDLVAASVRER